MMLRRGSGGTQLTVLVLVTLVTGQHYDADYDSGEGADSADYSKYYSSDSSSSLTQPKAESTGFVSPIDFGSSFGGGNFGPSFAEFGAASHVEGINSPKQNAGFVNPQEAQTAFANFKPDVSFGGGVDYFEQSQKASKTSSPGDKYNYELKPGPSYVSHKIVPPAQQKKHQHKPKYASEINDLNAEHKVYKPLKKEESVVVKSKPATFDFDFNKLPSQQYSGYPVPKTTVIDPKYLPQYVTKTPYQKYSFQPVAASTDFSPYTPSYSNYYPTYEPSSSEYVATLLQYNKNCKRVNKQVAAKPEGRVKRQAMDCYVCKDEKTGTNLEQCSYGSESSPQNYYVESSKKYSKPSLAENYRYKRYTPKDEKDDPYEYIKAQSQKYYSKPEDFESHYYDPKEYKYDPEYYTEEEEKSSSEKQSDELKSPENCKKSVKDGMTCTVCKNPKTGGNYEQCSYTTAPDEKKYAYVKEKKYNSDDDPEAETDGSEVNEKQVFGKKRKGEKARNPDEVERVSSYDTHRPSPSEKEDDYDVPEHFEESNKKNAKLGSKDLSPQQYESEDSARYEEKPIVSPHKDDYYYKHFPEHKEESKREEKKAEPEIYGYYGDGEEKKNVEEVLAEFAKKDRSQCKKAEKNGMTCYLCTDKRGLQHEECMYVSESKPQSKYAAYHAKQETPKDPKKEESVVVSTEVPSPKRKRFHKKASESSTIQSQPSRQVKVTTSPLGLQPQASKTVETKAPALKKRYPTMEAQASENVEVLARKPGVTEKVSKKRHWYPKNPEAQASETVEALSSKSARAYRRSKNIPAASKKVETKQKLEEDEVPQASEDEAKYRNEGESGAYADETQQVFSKEHGFSLPKYMLTKSQGELVYDEFVKNS